MGENQRQRGVRIAVLQRRAEVHRVEIRSGEIQLRAAADAIGMAGENEPVRGAGRRSGERSDFRQRGENVFAARLTGISGFLRPVKDAAVFQPHAQSVDETGFDRCQRFLEKCMVLFVARQSCENPHPLIRRMGPTTADEHPGVNGYPGHKSEHVPFHNASENDVKIVPESDGDSSSARWGINAFRFAPMNTNVRRAQS